MTDHAPDTDHVTDDDAHADDSHDAHEAHEVEDPQWVLAPLAVGFVIGIVLLLVFGIQSGAVPLG